MSESDVLQYFADFTLIGNSKKEFIAKTAFQTFTSHFNGMQPVIMSEENLFQLINEVIYPDEAKKSQQINDPYYYESFNA